MVKTQLIKEEYAIYQGDSIEVLKSFPDESIHLSIYSPPFGGLYHYSSDIRDLSNSDNYEDFFKHYEYLVKEKYRITMKGRCSAVHCSEIPTGNTGKDSLIDFPGDIVKLHRKNGFDYIGRHCIWKEPLTVRNRTMAKCLYHKTIVEDSIYGGIASADYLLVFRKKGINPIPIVHSTGLSYYAGERKVPQEYIMFKNYKGNQIKNKYSHWIWRQYASSFWDDIRIDNVLPFKDSRDEDDEKHVHPLQLDVIERCIILRSNEEETVLTPFAGIGSEVYGAVKNRRKGIGIELKESYFKQMIKNLQHVNKRNIDNSFI